MPDDPTIDLSWPISIATLRKALGFEADQGDPDELLLFASAACERIDNATGRDLPGHEHRHEKDGNVPAMFIMAARETGKLWWQQAKNGPRGLPSAAGDQPSGLPLSADLPRKVEGWLANYPPPPGFGQPVESSADPET